MIPKILVTITAVCLSGNAVECQTASASASLDVADDLVKPLIEEKITVGLTLGILQDGKTAIRGYGRIEKSGDQAPNGKTVYEIGSVSKVFTGLLFADAVERGLVKFDDPVQKHVPDGTTVPTFRKKNILLEHLTSHSSALPRLPPNMLVGSSSDPYKTYDRAALFVGLSMTKLTREPGSTYEYSNFAAGLLGQLLVDVQGKDSYEQLMRERICDPIGLADTRQELTPSMRKRLAPAYNAAGQRRSNWSFQSLAGAGAIRSTVSDMLKFAAANLDPTDLAGGNDTESFLPKAIVLAKKPRFTPPLLKRIAGEPSVGCGWHYGSGKHIVWHNGGTGGYRTHLLLDTKRSWAVVVLANTTSGKIDQLTKKIHQAMTGKKVKPVEIRKSIAVPEHVLRGYVGKYQLTPKLVFDITVGDGVLTASLTGQPRTPVFAASNIRFFYRAVKAELEFEVVEGEVTKLTLFQNGREMPAPRIK